MRCAVCQRRLPGGSERCPDDGGLALISVGEALARGPIALTQVVKVADRALEAVAARHAAGLIHGGLGPEVIFFAQTGADLVLQVGGEESPMPDAYAPPEDRASAAGDVFALGVLMHHMITGRLPALGGDLPSLSSDALQDVPEALDRLIQAMTARDAQRRPAPVEAVRATLENLELDSTLTGERLAHVRAEVAAAQADLPNRQITLSPLEDPSVDPMGDTFIRDRRSLEADALAGRPADRPAFPQPIPQSGADTQDTLLNFERIEGSSLDAHTEMLVEPDGEPRGKWVLMGAIFGLVTGGVAVGLALWLG